MQTLICLRSRSVRRAVSRYTSRSKEYAKLPPQQIFDPWIYCRVSQCIIGRASAVNVNGNMLELVEPEWMTVTAKVPKPTGCGSRLVRELPDTVLQLGPMRAFLAGKNRDEMPCWWRKGEAPEDAMLAAQHDNRMRPRYRPRFGT